MTPCFERRYLHFPNPIIFVSILINFQGVQCTCSVCWDAKTPSKMQSSQIKAYNLFYIFNGYPWLENIMMLGGHWHAATDRILSQVSSNNMTLAVSVTKKSPKNDGSYSFARYLSLARFKHTQKNRLLDYWG